jgi:hypothetical protein
VRPRSAAAARGREPRARSPISAQNAVSCAGAICCQGARRRPGDRRSSSVCCRRQNASLIPTLGCTPFGGYGQSSKAQPSTQVVPGADETAVPTVRPGLRESRERDARRQVGAVRALEAPLAVARLIAPLGEVEQQENVGDQLLGTPVERGPSGGRRDPQLAVAVPRLDARVTGAHLGDDAALVDPAVPLGTARLECHDGES